MKTENRNDDRDDAAADVGRREDGLALAHGECARRFAPFTVPSTDMVRTLLALLLLSRFICASLGCYHFLNSARDSSTSLFDMFDC